MHVECTWAGYGVMMAETSELEVKCRDKDESPHQLFINTSVLALACLLIATSL